MLHLFPDKIALHMRRFSPIHLFVLSKCHPTSLDALNNRDLLNFLHRERGWPLVALRPCLPWKNRVRWAQSVKNKGLCSSVNRLRSESIFFRLLLWVICPSFIGSPSIHDFIHITCLSHTRHHIHKSLHITHHILQSHTITNHKHKQTTNTSYHSSKWRQMHSHHQKHRKELSRKSISIWVDFIRGTHIIKNTGWSSRVSRFWSETRPA